MTRGATRTRNRPRRRVGPRKSTLVAFLDEKQVCMAERVPAGRNAYEQMLGSIM